MGFESLRFVNFRNLKDRELPLGAREVFLVGENGQGKTNLLETVHLLCLGSSFREKRESALMRDPSAAAAVHGCYDNEGDIGRTTLSILISPGRKKEIRVNDKLLAERRDLLSEVLCVCFVQQDMEFVTGPPEERRRFFDQTLVLSDLSFLDSLRGYRQVLKSRNLCLKTNRDDLLDVYDAQLAAMGLALQSHRVALVREFGQVFSPLFSEIMGTEENVKIHYRPSWDGLTSIEDVAAHLAVTRERDRLLGTTTSGPHRDACTYTMAGKDYVHYASTGQLRLCALALRMAQARFLAARTGRKPVLLLDDVLLELDPVRKKAFIARFPVYDQVFFTFLPDEGWQAYRTDDTLVLHVAGGGFT